MSEHVVLEGYPRVWKYGNCFNKCHILRYKEFSSGRIVAFLTFLGRRIAKKETSKGPRIKFVSVLLENVNKGLRNQRLQEEESYAG